MGSNSGVGGNFGPIKAYPQFGTSNNHMSNGGVLGGSFTTNQGGATIGGGQQMFSLDFNNTPVGAMPGTFFGSNMSGVSIDQARFQKNNKGDSNPNYNEMITSLLKKERD